MAWGVVVFVVGRWRIWTRRETRDRENAFANPATRGPGIVSGCSQGAFTGDNNRRHSTRNAERKRARATARLRRAKSERRINSVFSSRCPGYSALGTNESNTACTQRSRSRLWNPSDRMEADGTRCTFQVSSRHSPLREKFSRIPSRLRDIDNKKRIRVECTYSGKIR